jgi:hypothetical protein
MDKKTHDRVQLEYLKGSATTALINCCGNHIRTFSDSMKLCGVQSDFIKVICNSKLILTLRLVSNNLMKLNVCK